jgi:hypothetical protein
MNKNDGIVIANGVVLKDGLHKFQADKKVVSKSLDHIAKMTKGLYSGILNFDSDFQRFQNEALNDLVEKETEKICKQVITNAEHMLKKISGNMVSQKAVHDSYTRDRHGRKDVTTIDIDIKNEKLDTVPSDKVKDVIDSRISILEGISEKELEYIKEINKDVRKMSKERKKIREKINNKNAKKEASKKKVAKKKAKKSNGIAIRSNKIVTNSNKK